MPLLVHNGVENGRSVRVNGAEYGTERVSIISRFNDRDVLKQPDAAAAALPLRQHTSAVAHSHF